MLLAEVADQASQAAPLPAGDRLRMAARGRTVGAEASSYQALEVPEDRAQELHMLPLVAPVDKAHDPVLVGNRPEDPPVSTVGRIHRFYRPPDDTVRTELAEHSFSVFFLTWFTGLKWKCLLGDSSQLELICTVSCTGI